MAKKRSEKGLETVEIDILSKMKRAQTHMVFIVIPRFNITTLITMIETLRVANYLAPTALFLSLIHI